MGKSKGNNTSAARKKGATANAQNKPCTCDHPYQCACGNRPERPSKGHKWDASTQTWGGKGHTQKGGSGQVRVVAQSAHTTALGQTKIAQWQRLPSQLLQEFCRQHKRPPPKFKQLLLAGNSHHNHQKFKCRCIVPDPKGDSHKDLILVPAMPVQNEEQAQEEAAVLALLQLTPTLPHERKLPEPYKTTWLTAISALKEQQQAQAASTKPKGGTTPTKKNPSSSSSSTHTNGGGGSPAAASSSSNPKTRVAVATVNTNLALGTFHISALDRQKQQEEKRKVRNAKMRHYENVRMANRNPPVFLSAKLRSRIQRLLQESSSQEDHPHPYHHQEEEDVDDDEEGPYEYDEYSSDQQEYIEERLRTEGFTKRQARKAYEQLRPTSHSHDYTTEETATKWEDAYDECLQWLCVHLSEDQLPEGLDPRGSTLEVVVPTTTTTNTNTSKTAKATTSNTTNGSFNNHNHPHVQAIATKFGLLPEDAAWLMTQASAVNKEDNHSSKFETIFWNQIRTLAGDGNDNDDATTTTTTTEDHSPPLDTTTTTLEDEQEALEAIFPDLQILPSSDKKNKSIETIILPLQDDFTLNIVVDKAVYPWGLPQSVLILGNGNGKSGGGWPKEGVGVAVHVELAKFLATCERGEPLMFEVFHHAQTLLQEETLEDLPILSLAGTGGSSSNTTERSSSLARNQPSTSTAVISTTIKENGTNDNNTATTRRAALPSKRPRERGIFWSLHPTKTPPSTPFPKLSPTLARQRHSLPAGKARGDFLTALHEADTRNSRVVLVTGATGSGKTTQIPQFILEEAPESSKIVVAQPRRLAATGVAARVAEERGEDKPGVGSVGYTVRGDSAVGKNTRLLFCTYGILLRQLQSEGALTSITHVVIDEVHERNLDGDVLMALLKQCLDSTPHLRVILMSATLDADRFAAYWGVNTPRMHIPGRTFPVQDFFLEDVLALTGYIPPKKGKKKYFSGAGAGGQQHRQRRSTPWDDSELSDPEDGQDGNEDLLQEENGKTPSKSVTAFNSSQVPLEERVRRVDEERIDYDLLGQLVKALILDNVMGSDGSILVFLPGAPEINQAKTIIGKITSGMSVLLLPLHGGLQPKEQNLVFRPSSNGVKVILSTNVAETSITLPDCTVVIDGCREKQSSYDPVNRMPLLIEVFASQASMKQRRGRAGRVREGKCYKLISKQSHAKIHEHTAPEITRCALDQTLLSLLFLGVETGNGAFLQTLLDPPSQKSVDAAIHSLWKLGALEKVSDTELRLTPLGMHLAGIPAPPMVGKMLVMGSILGCRRAALAMAATISTGRSPFLRVDIPRKKGGEESIQQQKDKQILEERAKLFEQSGNSDHAMLAAAFMNWEDLPAGGGNRKRYCEKLGLSFNGMRDILQLTSQYSSALSSAGYSKTAESERNASSWRVLRTCAVSAMAPGQLVRVQRPSTKYESTAEGAREKDGVARELKFFIRVEDSEAADGKQKKEERVFIHPSSALFAVGNYSFPWLVYNSMVKTSKPFLRDATECNAYALLLFGGEIDVEARNGIISVDGWVKLSANARIGALIRGLRRKMDDLLADKIKNPSLDISGSPEMQVIVSLLLTDGMGG